MPWSTAGRRRWIVNDASELAAPLVARLTGVPQATHAFGALLPEHRLAATGDAVAPLWRAQGLEPAPYAGSYEHLYLDIYPPSMRFGSYDHVGRGSSPCGPCRTTARAAAWANR